MLDDSQSKSKIKSYLGRITNPHAIRQAIGTLAACFLSASGGLAFGATAVLLPQLQEDKDFPYDKEYDSWIASSIPLSMIAGCGLAGYASDALGRKLGQTLFTIPCTIGWIIIGVAKNSTWIIVGRVLTGVCCGAIRSLGMVFIGEISHPKYRAITLLCPSVGVFLGNLISHTLGHYLPWRISCFVFGAPTFLSFLIMMCLKESPLWLITKGKIELGMESFKWYRGESESAQAELKSVLEKRPEQKPGFVDMLKTVISAGLLKSFATTFFVFLTVQFSGINTITFYALQIFKGTFEGDVDEFMLMLVVDAIRVFSSIGVCIFGKKMPRKLSFIVCCGIISLTLAGVAIYLKLDPVGLVWLPVTLITVYVAVASVMASLGWAFVAEIFPNKVRGLAAGVSATISCSLLFITVYLIPLTLERAGPAVMYGSFGIITLVGGIILIFMLPETNGKSLQTIENTLYGDNKSKQTQNTQSNAA